jgi:hypothetical protein
VTNPARPPAQHVVPCGGIGDTAGPHACGNAPGVLTVPEDTHATFPDGSHPPAGPAHFSVWGGDLTGGVYDSGFTTPIGVNPPATRS